ncbi:MAG: ABC transporter substrate-binding protein [Chloroflexi bacterium]|nr:ABC transporter substrate-binding protein [Chloroflexota bacterium]
MNVKRFVLLVVAAALCGVLAVVPALAQETINIAVIGMDQAGMTPEELDAIAARFEAQNPNVNIETSYVLYDGLHDLLVTSISSDPPAFDVVLVDDIWFSEFVEAGWLLDVTDRITEAMRADIFEAAWDITTVQGRVYGMPWLLDQKYFYYNTRLLAEAGFEAPPRTWEELADQARAMQAQGLLEYPMIWSWGQFEAVVPDFVTLLYGNGGTFFDENNEPVFNSPEGVEVLQWMVEMINEGIVNPSSIAAAEEDVRNVFSQGQAAFATNWLYMYNLTQDPNESQVVGEVGMALMPVFADALAAGIESSTNNGSMGYAVTAGSANPDVAWAFIEFLTSLPIQVEFSQHQLPIWQSAFDDPALIEMNPVTTPMFALQFPWANVRPKVPYYNEASRIVQIAIQEALTGRVSAQEALDSAVEQIRELAAEYAN